MPDAKRHPNTLKPVLYSIPGMADVAVREATYGDDLAIDIYAPPSQRGPLPAVIFIAGYSDPLTEQFMGCKLKDMASYASWGRLIAASGMIGVTYANRTPDDAHAMLAHLRRHATALGIADQRLAIWACSGNVPMAMSLLDGMRCAALCYGPLGDLDDATHTAQAAAMFRFVNPAIPLDQLPALPLFIARAGRDEVPGVNASLDRFIPAALARDLPITLANHPTGPHAFDIVDDSPTTRAIIRQLLAFLQIHLLAD